MIIQSDATARKLQINSVPLVVSLERFKKGSNAYKSFLHLSLSPLCNLILNKDPSH
jgi:hypothetical protein